MTIKVGQHYTVDITDINHMGDGVAKVEDEIIFIAHTKLGERVEIEITAVKANVIRARAVKWIKSVDVKDIGFNEEPSPENEFTQSDKDIMTQDW